MIAQVPLSVEGRLHHLGYNEAGQLSGNDTNKRLILIKKGRSEQLRPQARRREEIHMFTIF